MEFDDYKIDPNAYHEMAKAYFSTLSKYDFRFIKVNADKTKKSELVNEISKNTSQLDAYIQQLQQTNKAKNNKTNLSEITKNLLTCKQIFHVTNTPSNKPKLNLCCLIKKTIEICTQNANLCFSFFNYSTNENEDKMFKCADNFLEIIKNVIPLWGECHYRY